MITKEEILLILEEILRENCGVEVNLFHVKHFGLVDDLGLDSMGLLALTAEVENRFQIYLEEDLSHPPQNLEDVLNLIWERLNEREGKENCQKIRGP